MNMNVLLLQQTENSPFHRSLTTPNASASSNVTNLLNLLLLFLFYFL